MPSAVAICNMALSHVGKGSINDMSEASTEARQCSLHYDQTRDVMLQGYDWRFATKRQALALITNTWEQRFAYAYQRPSDCLKPIRFVLEVDDASSITRLPFDQTESTIFGDIEDAVLEYVYRVTDPTKFSPLFVEALSWALAAKIAMPLTRDQSIRRECYQMASATLNAAQTADANEVPTYYDHASEFIEARA